MQKYVLNKLETLRDPTPAEHLFAADDIMTSQCKPACTATVSPRCKNAAVSTRHHRASANAEEKLDLVYWLFDLRVSERRSPAMDYRSVEFGVDSCSRFPFRAPTDRQTNKKQTDATEYSISRRRLYSGREIKRKRWKAQKLASKNTHCNSFILLT